MMMTLAAGKVITSYFMVTEQLSDNLVIAVSTRWDKCTNSSYYTIIDHIRL